MHETNMNTVITFLISWPLGFEQDIFKDVLISPMLLLAIDTDLKGKPARKPSMVVS